MNRLRTVAREIWGLFVDDGRFAAAIVLWLLVSGLALPHIGLPARWGGPVLFAGLALLLVASAARYARKSR